jgi:hypothetical protein
MQFHFGEYLIKFSVQCISNAASSRENNGSCIREKENNTCHTDIQVYSLLIKWKIQETLVRYPRNSSTDWIMYQGEGGQHLLPCYTAYW